MQEFLRQLVDRVYGFALGDHSVPSTEIADKLIGQTIAARPKYHRGDDDHHPVHDIGVVLLSTAGARVSEGHGREMRLYRTEHAWCVMSDKHFRDIHERFQHYPGEGEEILGYVQAHCVTRKYRTVTGDWTEELDKAMWYARQIDAERALLAGLAWDVVQIVQAADGGRQLRDVEKKS